MLRVIGLLGRAVGIAAFGISLVAAAHIAGDLATGKGNSLSAGRPLPAVAAAKAPAPTLIPASVSAASRREALTRTSYRTDDSLLSHLE